MKRSRLKNIVNKSKSISNKQEIGNPFDEFKKSLPIEIDDNYRGEVNFFLNGGKPNIFRRPNGEYFYQASPESEKITVTPLNTLFDNPAYWTYEDAAGRRYTPRQLSETQQGEVNPAENVGAFANALNQYFREGKYKLKNGIPLGGKYTMPAIAASALLPLAGEAFAGISMAGIPATTWADAALTAGFGAHGLNHVVNKGLNGYGDAAMTALEIAPLGRLTKPMWNAGKEGMQYVAKVADNTARHISPSYDFYRIISETKPKYTRVPSKNLFRTLVYKGGEITDPHSNFVTTDPLYAANYGKVTPYIFESKSIAKAKEPMMGYKDPVNMDMFIYNNTKRNPNATAIIGHDTVTGEFTPSKGIEILNMNPKNLYPVKTSKPSTIKWTNATRTPQITAENAASEMPNIVRTVLDNGKIRLSLPSHTDNKPRQFVLEPAGDNKYYVHMRMWDDIENKVPASNVTNEEKQQLFDALYNELPEGAEILFPKSGLGNYGTRGTVAGLQRLSRDSRFTPGTKGILQYLDKDGKTVRTYEGTSFIKTPRITEANAASMTPEQWTAAQDAAANGVPIESRTIYVKSPKDITSDIEKLIAEGKIRSGITDDVIAPKTTVDYYKHNNGKYYRVTLLDKYKSFNLDNHDTNLSPEQWTAAQDAAIAKALNITPEEAAFLTEEQFNAAIANGADITEAQRLRDLYFKIKANTKLVADNKEGVITDIPASFYHSTEEPQTFTAFDLNRSGLNWSYSNRLGRKAIWFEPNYPTTDWGNYHRRFYINSQTPYIHPTLEVFDRRVVPKDADAVTVSRLYPYPLKYWGQLPIIKAKEKVIPNMQTAVFDPKNIKSADAVTFDDSGRRIGLGERDNFNINDNRYSWLPWFLGGSTAATLYNKSK